MRNRCAWGPTYFGPGKRSVTRATGQTVLQTLHFRHSSADRATSNDDASWTMSMIVIGRRSGRSGLLAGGEAPGRGRHSAPTRHADRWRPQRRRRSARRGSAGRPACCRRPRRSRRPPCRRRSTGWSRSSVRMPAGLEWVAARDRTGPVRATPRSPVPRRAARAAARRASRPICRRARRRRCRRSPGRGRRSGTRARAAAAAIATAVTLRPSTSTLTTSSPTSIRPPRRAEGRPERLVEPQSRHARRDERHLERGQREQPPGVAERPRVVGKSEDRRQGDPAGAGSGTFNGVGDRGQARSRARPGHRTAGRDAARSGFGGRRAPATRR